MLGAVYGLTATPCDSSNKNRTRPDPGRGKVGNFLNRENSCNSPPITAKFGLKITDSNPNKAIGGFL